MNFVAIDFETADRTRFSPCQIGLTTVEDGKIISTETYLIKPTCFPHFEFYNSSIHGILAAKVENEPTFDILWNDIKHKIDGKILISHSTVFDIQVLKQTLSYYNIPFPSIKFFCTHMLSKKTWPMMGVYNLEYLNEEFDLGLDDHHDAGSDSLAAAKLALKILYKNKKEDFDAIAALYEIPAGILNPTTYKSFVPQRIYRSKSDKYKMHNLIIDESKHDPESIFYGKTVVFTGALNSMTRAEAFQKITDIGGIISDRLNKETNFLIEGQQSSSSVGPGGLSQKQIKAKAFAEKGIDIEVLNEITFINNL